LLHELFHEAISPPFMNFNHEQIMRIMEVMILIHEMMIIPPMQTD